MIENHPEEEKVTERIQKGYKGYREDTESNMTVTKQTNWTLASQIPSQKEISKQTKDSTHGGYFDGWRCLGVLEMMTKKMMMVLVMMMNYVVVIF